MLKALRRSYWLTQMFLGRHYKIIVRSTLTVLALLSLYLILEHYLPTYTQIERIGLIGKYTLDTLPTSLKSQISLGLVQLDYDGVVKPGLAKSYEISPDGKTYTFHLDPELVWQDGSSVTPADISYNFQNVTFEPKDQSIIYHLQEPFSPFIAAVTNPLLKNNRLGVGEYRIQKTQTNSGFLVSLTLVSTNLKKVYKFYPTENSALTALRLGEIDQVIGLTSVPPHLLSDPALIQTEIPNQRMTALFFNLNDNLLSSKTTRQGIAYAINDKTFGHPRALSPLASTSWAYNNLVKDYTYDPVKARSLFTTDAGSSAITLELKTTLSYLDIAEKIAADLRETLQISVDVKVVTTITNDFQLLLVDFIPPLDPDQYTTWHSTQPTNFTHYNNLKVDKLLEDGRRTLDPKLRKDIYFDFQRFLLEDSPAVFLFHTSSYTLSHQPLF